MNEKEILTASKVTTTKKVTFKEFAVYAQDFSFCSLYHYLTYLTRDIYTGEMGVSLEHEPCIIIIGD